jgi:hypothetical protein
LELNERRPYWIRYRGHHRKTDEQKVKKLDGTFTATDQESRANVKAEYFGEKVFGRASPFEPEAVEEIKRRQHHYNIMGATVMNWASESESYQLLRK